MTYCYGKKRECAMHQHIDKLMAIVNGLQIAELEIKDMDVNVCLLMYLLTKFDVIKVAIENQPNDNLSWISFLRHLYM